MRFRGVSDKVSGRIEDKVSDRVSGRVEVKVSDWVWGRVLGRGLGLVSDLVSDRVSGFGFRVSSLGFRFPGKVLGFKNEDLGGVLDHELLDDVLHRPHLPKVDKPD